MAGKKVVAVTLLAIICWGGGMMTSPRTASSEGLLGWTKKIAQVAILAWESARKLCNAFGTPQPPTFTIQQVETLLESMRKAQPSGLDAPGIPEALESEPSLPEGFGPSVAPFFSYTPYDLCADKEFRSRLGEIAAPVTASQICAEIQTGYVHNDDPLRRR